MNLFKLLARTSGKVSIGGVIGVATLAAGIIGPTINITQEAAKPRDRYVFTDAAMNSDRQSIYDSGMEGSFSNSAGIRASHDQDVRDVVDAGQIVKRGFSGSSSDASGYALQGADALGGNPNFVDVTKTKVSVDTSNSATDSNFRASVADRGLDGISYGGNGTANGGGTGDSNGGAGGTTINTLSGSSMARSSGGSSAPNNGAYQGSSASGTAGSNARQEGYTELSGSMPSSDSLNSALLASAATIPGKASFGGPETNLKGGRATGVAGRDLERTARFTGKVAAKGNDAAANEGAKDFLGNGNITLGGGLSYGEAKDGPTTSDLNSLPDTNSIKRKLGHAAGNAKAHAKALADARKSLAIQLLAMLGAGVAAAAGIYFMLNAAKKKEEEAALERAKAQTYKAMAAGNMYSAAAYEAKAAACEAKAKGLDASAKLLRNFAKATVGAYALYAGIMITQCGLFISKWKNEAGSLPTSGIMLATAASVAVGLVYKFGATGKAPSQAITDMVGQNLKEKVGEVADEATASDNNTNKKEDKK